MIVQGPVGGAVAQVGRDASRHRDRAHRPPLPPQDVKGGEKAYTCGGGIVYHRQDEKEPNWEAGGVRSGAGVRSSGVSQESSG